MGETYICECVTLPKTIHFEKTISTMIKKCIQLLSSLWTKLIWLFEWLKQFHLMYVMYAMYGE